MPRIRRPALAALLLTLTVAAALTALSAAPPESPKRPAKTPPRFLTAAYPRAAARKSADATDVYQVFNMEFDGEENCAAFKADGVYVDARFQKFAQVMVKSPDDLASVEDPPGLVWLEAAGKAVVPPAPPPVETAEKGIGNREKVVHGGLDGLTGKGVLVAVVDSGVDFRHPDFQADGKSRLVAFWDTLRPFDGKVGAAAPVTFPDGTPIGTVLSQQDLNDDLAGKTSLGPADQDGHGTACAGVAAGAGAIDEACKGVAPDADLIAVRIGAGEEMENSYLLPSIFAWLKGVAADRKEPLVISCSFGGHGGAGGDGDLIVERWLDALLPETEPGRVVCIAAGNDGDNNIHANVQCSKDKKGYLSWEAAGDSAVAIFLDGVALDDVDVKAAGDTKFGKAGAYVVPYNNTLVIGVEIPAGRGGFFLTTTRDQPVSGDAYLWSNDPARFTKGGTNARQITSPGAARNPFTIGSYDFDDRFVRRGRPIALSKDYFAKTAPPLTFGALSEYSDAGFLRASKVVKPDLAAPGRYFTAPASADGGKEQEMVQGGAKDRYQAFAGTSAATPYAAGVFALLLQGNPNLSAKEIRNLLKEDQGLTRDDFTRDCPNPSWGYGKLDLEAAKRLVAAAKGK